jgi:hypothetical protein
LARIILSHDDIKYDSRAAIEGRAWPAVARVCVQHNIKPLWLAVVKRAHTHTCLGCILQLKRRERGAARCPRGKAKKVGAQYGPEQILAVAGQISVAINLAVFSFARTANILDGMCE